MKMEIRLDNGAVCANGLGLPETAEGLEALLQRVYNRLNTVRGSFPYDRELGSRIPEMTLSENTAEEALRFAQEALLSCPEVTVQMAVLSGDTVTVTLSTPLGAGSVTVYRREKEEDDL